MAHHVTYVVSIIALLTFAFNEFQRWREQLKKWLVMAVPGVTSSWIFLKQTS